MGIATASQTDSPTATATLSVTSSATDTATNFVANTSTTATATTTASTGSPATKATAPTATETTSAVQYERTTPITTPRATTPATASATAAAISTTRPLSGSALLQQQQVEATAAAATAALGVLASPLAANKGTTMSRVLAGRECRWAAPEPEPTQFVYVFDAGGSAAAGGLIWTVLLQAVAAAAAVCTRTRRFPHVIVLHLATLSYYGPNVAALATVMLSSGEGGLAAAAGLVLNAALLGVAAASAWTLAAHHRALWKEARDPRSALVRVYGAVDLACAFAVGALSGAGGLACSTRGVLICVACLVNLAHAALVRPAARPLLLSATAPREPTYDAAVLALAAAIAAWMYLLLAFALAGIRRLLQRCQKSTEN